MQGNWKGSRAGEFSFSTLTAESYPSSVQLHPLNKGLSQFISKDKRTQSVSLQALLPLLKKAVQESNQTGLSCSKVAIINVSTIGGSIGNNPSMATFPVISYRCTKTALNMLTRCQSVTHKQGRILCIAQHPGWVKTEQGTAKAELTVEDSVQGILKVLSTCSEKHHGIVVNWTERTVPW
ncbi:C-factor-like [Mauremys reevesii]|uniref:C-factor-like n=1 Tax=Mauremys reevesii TaxID=260615 RepID=UPI00193FD490|nr:C-factor-like [Mauremys reevesii]